MKSAIVVAGRGHHHRALAEERAQQDLQAAVAAGVVEGAPDRRRLGARRRLDRAGEALKAVDHQFRRPGRPGREHHPFGRQRHRARRVQRVEGQADSDERPFEAGWQRRFGNDRLGARDVDNAGQGLVGEIRRAEHDAPGDAVEFDQRDRRVERIGDPHQHRTPGERARRAAQGRAAGDIGERQARPRAPDLAPHQSRRGHQGAIQGQALSGHAHRTG
jgi:hypothetical protein